MTEGPSAQPSNPARPATVNRLVLRINGEVVPVDARPTEPLLWTLRSIGLTGTKPGCGIGVCGSCVVLVDGSPTRSCVVTTGDAVGHDLLTIEGLATGPEPGDLHPVQRAFLAAGAPQCGWCMSGQILTAVALLAAHSQPSDADIGAAMSEVLCRCGAYGRVRAAVRAAANGEAAASGTGAGR